MPMSNIQEIILAGKYTSAAADPYMSFEKQPIPYKRPVHSDRSFAVISILLRIFVSDTDRIARSDNFVSLPPLKWNSQNRFSLAFLF